MKVFWHRGWKRQEEGFELGLEQAFLHSSCWQLKELRNRLPSDACDSLCLHS